jgi:hypothetical protein
MSFNYRNEPTKEQKKYYRNFVLNLENILPCKYCRINLKKNYRIYYKDNEWYSYDKDNKKYYLIDFYIRELNIGIEFNGDIWHANPKKYKPEDTPFPLESGLNAKDIWEKDRIKNDFLRTKLNKLIIIWENDLKIDGIDKTVDKIIKEIYE